jgi:hypothetical protein
MGTTYRYLATIDEAAAVLDWFRTLPERTLESALDEGSLFHFPEFGPLQEARRSPLVTVFLPTNRRGVLTTVGEVHFMATPLTPFPGLNRVSKRFHDWLRQYPRVFSRRTTDGSEWDHFLEGSARNYDSDIFALPGGMTALRQGAYFIDRGDSDSIVDQVCRRLELRGVVGTRPPDPGGNDTR